MNKRRDKINPYIWLVIAIVFALVGLIGKQVLPEQENSRAGQTEWVQDKEELHFRNTSYLEQHFEKHGEEFPYDTKEEYEEGANKVIASEETLHKIEAEDGDDVYYLEKTNEFVIVSTDGYIRTYFKPKDGIEYYNRQ